VSVIIVVLSQKIWWR